MVIYQTQKDDELCLLLKQGDKDAFVEIFNRYNSLLYLFAFKKLQDSGEAEDIVQDVFYAVWLNRAHIKFESYLPSYLYRAVLNQIRKKFSHQKVERRYLNDLEGYLHSYNADTDYRIREKDIAELINSEIELLPEKMKAVFLLSKVENLSNKEIAATLGLSEEVVRQRLSRSLRILRQNLTAIAFSYLMFGGWNQLN